MLLQRMFDLLVACTLLVLLSPVLIILMILVWRQDRHSPLYIAPRAAKGGGAFSMYKLRSMIINADSNQVDSTSAKDPRITNLGRFIRKCKFDEFPQLWNVIKGDMSLVGPRPNVLRETALYTQEEQQLLNIRPGITDLASIVFADEGDILKDSTDPDGDYHRLIRPWKNHLALIYVKNPSFSIYFSCLILTAMTFFDRKRALEAVSKIALLNNASKEVVEIAKRRSALVEAPPPGGTSVVRTRSLAGST